MSNSPLRKVARIRARVRQLGLVAAILIVLFLVWQVTVVLAPQPMDLEGHEFWGGYGDRTLHMILTTISTIAKWLFIILAGITLAVLGLQAVGAVARFGKLFEIDVDEVEEVDLSLEEATAEIEKDVPEEVRGDITDIAGLMHEVHVAVDHVEARRGNALVLFQDAQMHATTLAALIVATAAKAARLEKDRDLTIQLQTAIVTPAKDGEEELREGRIAELAGQIGDQSILALAIDPNLPRYQTSFVKNLNVQAGALLTNLQALDDLARLWVLELAKIHSRASELKLIADAAGALPSLLVMEGQITAASRALGWEIEDVKKASQTHRIEVHDRLREVPAPPEPARLTTPTPVIEG
jgi:hypothetical protein